MGLTEALAFLTRFETWSVKLVWAIIIVVAGYVIIRTLDRVVDYLLPPRSMPDHPYGTPQEMRTLAALIKSISRYVGAFLILGFLLKVFNVNLTPLLVSAGIVGFAIGFGAQGLIKDVISGLGLLFERSISVGDCVEISGYVGVVEEIGIRTTKIRDKTGGLNILFNGNITSIRNLGKSPIIGTLDVFLQKEEDTEAARRILERVLSDYAQGLGIEELDVRISSLDLRSPQTIVRVQFRLAPLFRDIVTQQIVPRLKELLPEQNIRLSADRIEVILRTAHPRRKDRTSEKRTPC